MRPFILSQVFNLCLFQLLDLSSKCRNYFIQITNYAVISNVEDVGILILVDSNDAVRAAHACYVLDSAGDTASNVKLRSNGLAGLANLVSMCDPAAVNSCTGSTYYAAEQICKGLKSGVESLRAAHSASAGYDDVSAFEIDHLACCVFDSLKDACADVFGSDMIIFFDDLSLVLAGFGFLEDAGTNSTALRGTVPH